MKKMMKKIVSVFAAIVMVIGIINFSYAATSAGQEMRTNVLYLADIIENDNNMNDYITRDEFARMVVKASKYKDSISSTDYVSAFSDVLSDNPYAPYIKIAAREGYIPSFMSGLFKPNDYVTYKDLTRACLALLGYSNTDFTGNQINGRFETFTSLKLNKDIDKNINDFVTKKDCVNGIYNTLKCNSKSGGTYGTSVFKEMTTNSDGELNASGLKKATLDGPFILKKNEAINLAIPFSLENANIFINGVAADQNEVARELGLTGYLIYYYNTVTKTVYIYKEGTTLDTDVKVYKGYVNHIYYSASDTVTPTKVQIDLAYYNLGNTAVKSALSYSGTISIGDQVVFIYNDTSSSTSSSDDEDYSSSNVTTTGTITSIYLYDLRY